MEVRGHCIWRGMCEPSNSFIQSPLSTHVSPAGLRPGLWGQVSPGHKGGISFKMLAEECIISRGCLPHSPARSTQAGGLEQQKCPLTVLDAPSLESRCQRGCAPSETCMEGPVCLFQLLVVAVDCQRSWLTAASVCSLPLQPHGAVSSHGAPLVCLSLLRRKPVFLG